MKNYKTTHKMYSAWNYQREIEDLNRMSEQGWQLIEGGMFSSHFKRNSDVRYRYQLDYQPKIEERARYIESFREFGWEYVNSTLNGWHYFRKLYDPALPEEEYEIFSDRSSLEEMNSRWAKLGIGLAVVSFIIAAAELVFMFLRPMLPTLILLLAYAVLLTFLIRGIIIMKNPEKSKSSKADITLTTVLLIAIFGGLLAGCVLMSMRPNMESNMRSDKVNPISTDLEDALLWNTIEVKYRDNYYLDVELDTDTPITLTIIDAEGNVVYNITDSPVSVDDVKVRLDRGEYRLYLSDYAGGRLNADFEIN